MSKTEEILATQAKNTIEQAIALATLLATILPPEKQPVQMHKELIRDGQTPAQQIRLLLSSAYDWFAYGN